MYHDSPNDCNGTLIWPRLSTTDATIKILTVITVIANNVLKQPWAKTYKLFIVYVLRKLGKKGKKKMNDRLKGHVHLAHDFFFHFQSIILYCL